MNAAAKGGRSDAHRGWLVVWVTFALYVCACIDRQVLPLLVEPIKSHLGVSDGAMGLLIGLGFSLFYSATSLPAGALVDRIGRRGLLAGSVALWSAMMAAGGLSNSYAGLFATRAGVAAAEGTIAPASYSLIRERVPPERRGRAFGIFSMAPYIGGSLALLLGGALLSAADAGAFAAMPLLGRLEQWQVVLVVLGIGGLLLVPLPLLLAPDMLDRPAAGGTAAGFGAAIRHMRANAAIYAPLVVYTTLSTLVVFANGPWLPALVARRFGMALPDIGYTYGLVKIVAAPAGLLLVGYAIDRLTVAGRTLTGVGVATLAVTLVAFAAVPFAPTAGWTFAIKAVGLLFSGAYAAIGAVVVAQRTPAALVGKVTAIYLLFQSVLGTGLGPLLTGVLATSVLGGDPLAIGVAMLMSTLGVGIPAMGALLILHRALVTQANSTETANGG